MLARAIIPGTLFLAGSAIAAAVHPARDAKTSVVIATQEVTRAFTSVIAATEEPHAVTSVVAASEAFTQAFTSVVEATPTGPIGSYVQDGTWTSSIGPVYTSGPCYCPVPVSIPAQTSIIDEPITLTVTAEPWSSYMPDAVTWVSSSSGAVTSVIPDAVTSVVRRAAVTSVSPDAVTSSFLEPTPTTMVVTVFPSSSGIPGPVTMCGCAAASTSPEAFTSTQSVVEATTQPAGVPTTQAVQAVSTSRFASTTSLSETASVGNNLLLNANGAGTKVASVQLVAIATFFGLVGAGITLI